ncbi:MFS transporter [Falsiroseomonas sp.]|uniref:MFS transporter n=1 Tax=Falsiroseomonas sp. TaxID=2870721 RepID=UPI003F6F615C
MNPPVWLMATAAFTVGCGMRMIEPLLPMMAQDFGTGLGGVAPLIGGFALAYGVGQFAIGPLGDRFGKIRVVAISLAIYAGMLVGAGLAEGLSTLLLFRVLMGLAAAAIVPLFMAHIGDSVPYGQRQAVLGKFLNGMVLSQLLAGPLSGIVGEYAGWRWAFLGLGIVAVLITAFFIARLGAPLWRAPAESGRGAGLAGFLKLLRKKAGRRLMIGTALDGLLMFGGAFPFLASLLIERFGMSAAEAGLVVASFGIGSLTYTQSAGWLLARLGERGMVMVGGIGVALALVVFALSPWWWAVAVAQACVGLLFFMLHGSLQARATEALPEARGTAVAGFAMALFLGQSVGSVIFGTMIVWAGFSFSMLVAAIGLAALTLWLRGVVLRPA